MIIVVIPSPPFPPQKEVAKQRTKKNRPRNLHLIGQPISAAGTQDIRQVSRQLQPVVRRPSISLALSEFALYAIRPQQIQSFHRSDKKTCTAIPTVHGTVIPETPVSSVLNPETSQGDEESSRLGPNNLWLLMDCLDE
jgi:hypothetical protein